MRYRTRLFKTHNVVIKRPQPSTYDPVSFTWITPDEPQEIPIQCNIQPFRANQKRWVLPEGMRVEHCIIVYSQDIVFKTTSSWSKTEADTFEHKGYEWECHQDQDWTGFQLSVDHSACLAVRKDITRDIEQENP